MSAKHLADVIRPLDPRRSFSELARRRVSAATYRQYVSNRRRIEAILAALGEQVLTKDRFLTMLRALDLEGAGRSTPNSWRSAVLFFQRVEGWACSEEGRAWAGDEDVVIAVQGCAYQAKGRVRAKGAFTADVVRRVVAHWEAENPENPWMSLLLVQYAIGARPSELKGLRVGCLRYPATGGLAVHLDVVKVPRGCAGQLDADRPVLKHWERFVTGAVEAAREEGRSDKDYLFDPAMCRIQRYREALKAAAEAIGLPADMTWSPHGARHGKAVDLLDKKIRQAVDDTAEELQMSRAMCRHYARPNMYRGAGAKK